MAGSQSRCSRGRVLRLVLDLRPGSGTHMEAKMELGVYILSPPSVTRSDSDMMRRGRFCTFW
jgi:hypothetical protein